MAYIGGELSSFFRDRGKLTDLANREIAEAGGDLLHDKVIENTPIGGTDFDGEGGGNLRASWRREPTNKRRGPLGTEYVSEVSTDVDYAPFIEHGWGLWGPSHSKYLIKPKRAGGSLRWKDRETGQWVYAKSVMHPGAPGAHMMQAAAAYTEAFWDQRAERPLERWKRAIEAQAD